MARETTLQAVDPATLESLRIEPEEVNALEPDPELTWSTYMPDLLRYLLTGSLTATVEDAGPIAGALSGYRGIATPTLEDGEFRVVDRIQVGYVHDALRRVDIAELRARAEAIDFPELVDNEGLYEIEPFLAEGVDLPADAALRVTELAAFYARAEREQLAVVITTT